MYWVASVDTKLYVLLSQGRKQKLSELKVEGVNV